MSVVTNGDGGGAVSCDHMYGPPFGLSGAGNLSITIATGRCNAHSQCCPRHHYQCRCHRPLSPLSFLTPPLPPQLSSLAAVTIVKVICHLVLATFLFWWAAYNQDSGSVKYNMCKALSIQKKTLEFVVFVPYFWPQKTLKPEAYAWLHSAHTSSS